MRNPLIILSSPFPSTGSEHVTGIPGSTYLIQPLDHTPGTVLLTRTPVGTPLALMVSRAFGMLYGGYPRLLLPLYGP